ncbi:N-acetyltransferase [Pleionea sp. CnH1-48]|uniref:GNAT family N-acetyltransferase n=1 Tax=Pleionea sp. CnH1-48 TaxID=2954494 RepID=UPI00209855DE|nr:GNAT family N-acetyltransferase [Pleionea sp. CnH1-48]MCO7224184.1 GNAT family N-acetyltransferase [Pleionea sp. CnH1-48]
MTDWQVRNYQDGDEAKLNDVAVAAFSQYQNDFVNWSDLKQHLRCFGELASTHSVKVIDTPSGIAAGVVYVSAEEKRAEHFPDNVPIVRMLVVDPAYRGRGFGRTLMQVCIEQAKRDKVPAIALHTSHIMEVALSMYLRMGFQHYGPAPTNRGVEYAVYLKKLNSDDSL